jgi:hypothetical protein
MFEASACVKKILIILLCSVELVWLFDLFNTSDKSTGFIGGDKGKGGLFGNKGVP